MIWGLLKRIITFGTPVPGADWITVSIEDRWPRVSGVVVMRSSITTVDGWPRVVDARVARPGVAFADRWPKVDGVRVAL